KLLFLVEAPGYRPELWISDGTAAGTKQVPVVIDSPFNSVDQPHAVGTAGGLYFFRTGNQLWRTAGTADGTFRLGMLGWDDLQTQWVIEKDDELWFTARSGTQRAVIRSDGTVDGTTVVFSAPELGHLTKLGDEIYFIVNDNQIYRTDGTTAGTVPITAEGGP